MEAEQCQAVSASVASAALVPAVAALLPAPPAAISMAPTVGGATTSVSLVGGEAKSYAPRGFYTARGESSSLAYRTVHWRKLKPANQKVAKKYVLL